MYIHGHQPAALLKGTILSIPKDCNKNLSVDTNYRGICLCSSIAKLFDLVVLARNKDYLQTSDMQYAFKPKLGTSMCSLVLKEVVNYYMQSGSKVYACFLDATKAFDRVRYDQLFKVLMSRGVHAPDLRLLLNMYDNQNVRTVWKKQHSAYFQTANGIKQGGIISPTLFCIYLDSMLCKLREEGYGCWVGKKYFGCLTYADDVTLLCPSVYGLQKMLQQCEHFCGVSDLQFNSSKSMCICFSKRVEHPPSLTLNSNTMVWVTSVKHLGNYIQSNLSEEKEVQMKRADLIGRTNVVLGTLSGLQNDVINKVFQSQCCHFYGAQAWNLTDPAISKFVTMYNRCVRRMLGLPHNHDPYTFAASVYMSPSCSGGHQ